MVAVGAVLGGGAALAPEASARPDMAEKDSWATLDGEQLFHAACANCHGDDGRGAAPTQVGFQQPLPDFSDCEFANREADPDWAAVIRDGGPARGFTDTMPAFGGSLGHADVKRVLDHLRTFCTEPSWPRGELNFARPFYTSKAFPEDEAVLVTTIVAEDETAITNALSYEKRFGPASNLELTVPFAVLEQVRADGSHWTAGIGDVAFGLKTVVWHHLDTGSIVSLASEAILPTGDKSRALGKGFAVIEPFVAYGQALPVDGFLQAQLGAELPLDAATAPAVFWRLALGITGTQGLGGRAWSPMVEVLGDQELEDGKTPDWDVVPGLQVTLSARQHVRLGIATRLPMTHVDERDKVVRTYLLWDWFDGGLFEGW